MFNAFKFNNLIVNEEEDEDDEVFSTNNKFVQNSNKKPKPASSTNKWNKFETTSKRKTPVNEGKQVEYNEDDYDENDEESELIFEHNDLYLCVLNQNNKLACSFYDANKKCLFYLNDLPENNKNYELTNLIIDDTEPDVLITNANSDLKFIQFLRNKCETNNPSDEELNDSLNDLDVEENDEEENEADLKKDLVKKKIRFILMANVEFNYELSKEKIFQIRSLERMPELMSDVEKNLFFSCLFDFESKLAVRSIGALLRHLERSSTLEQTASIKFVKPLRLDKLLFLDFNSFKSLQIFNDVDYQCAYRQTLSNSSCFRTTLNNKLNAFNITLYGLFLSKMQTKIGIGKLRSFLMKPTRDAEVLTQRHRVLEFFISNHNQDLIGLVKSALRKCKFVAPVFKRMRISRVKFSDWKRLYRTTQALVTILNLSRVLNERLNGKESVGRSESTSTIGDLMRQSIFRNLNANKINSRSNSSIFKNNMAGFNARSNSYLSEAFDFKGNVHFPSHRNPSFSLVETPTVKRSTTSESFSLFSASKPPSKFSPSVQSTPQQQQTPVAPLFQPKSLDTESLRSSSIFSSIMPDSEAVNLFSRISHCHYSSKFEHLLNLFELTVNIKESEVANKCKINANISAKLDEKKRVYSRLNELLTQICREEMDKYDLDECNISYIPQLGFLLVIKQSYFRDEEELSKDDASDFTDSVKVKAQSHRVGQQRRAEFEFVNQLKFVFKTDDLVYYKSGRMVELDEEHGDISCDINDLEAEIMDRLQDEFIRYSHYYANLIEFCAELDTLLAFAMIAKENNYVKPAYCSADQSEDASFMIVRDGRHPLLEIVNDEAIFVPNDICTGAPKFSTDEKKDFLKELKKENKVKVITAPNASGKTIYLKQVGLILYMSMIGSYVPASKALIGDFDRIYTRINSSDSLAQGKSTFAVDVQQVADALNGSSPKSLILLDEFGKGTLASDGQAILAALIRKWVSGDNSPHVFISTHYYEMFQRDEILFKENRIKIEYLTFEYLFDDEKEKIKSTTTTTTTANSDEDYEIFKKKIIYLYKLINGLTRSSYAINVAKRAGLPEKIVERSTNLLKLINENLDTDADVLNGRKKPESKFDLLRTTESNQNFMRCKTIAKKILELNLEIKETLIKEENLKTKEDANEFKYRKYKDFMDYLKNTTRAKTDSLNKK